MKLIQLRGKHAVGNYEFAMVDDEDYEKLNLLKWCLSKCVTKSKTRINDTFYATHGFWNFETKTGYLTTMHRMIMSAQKGQIVDHKDGNTMNNQKSNLRFATNSQNGMNKKPRGMSKYLGVNYLTKNKKWRAKIVYCGKSIYLGSFPFNEDGEVLAAKCYDQAAKKYHGEFANLNFKD